jgi:hypothetical protein
MWNGICPQTPPRNEVYSVNPNAFLTSPWYEDYVLVFVNIPK